MWATVQTVEGDGWESRKLRSFVKLVVELLASRAAFAVPIVLTCKQAARVAVVVS